MCLGIPGRISQLEGQEAVVDFFGVSRKVRLDLLDEPAGLGDYVLVHVGFAIHKIPPEEVDKTLALFDELLAMEGELALGAGTPNQSGGRTDESGQ